jgi:nitric oxide dioxygenase
MHDTKIEGDIIRVSPPCREFHLDPVTKEGGATVLISGGIDLTPLLAIMKSLFARNSRRPISWIHGSRSARVRPFSKHIDALARIHESLQVTFFEDHPDSLDIIGVDYDFQGVVDLKRLDGDRVLFLSRPDTQYFICGPNPFMIRMESELLDRGVNPRRIKMEKFGAGGIERAGY